MVAPEKKPKNMATRTVPAAVFTASRQKMIIAMLVIDIIARLNTPTLGASKPGTIRPIMLAALRMEVLSELQKTTSGEEILRTVYEARFKLTPCFTADNWMLKTG